MIQSKRLIPIMIATTLVFSSFSTMAQTGEELFRKAMSIHNESKSLIVSKFDWELGRYIAYPEKAAQREALLKESAKLLEEAVKKGHPEAEYALWDVKSDMSYSILWEQNCTKSKPLVIELSKQDVHIEAKARALFHLGVLHNQGRCAREDKLKALELYGQACDLGSQDGCLSYSSLKILQESQEIWERFDKRLQEIRQK